MALVGNTMKLSVNALLNLKMLLSEFLCYAKGSQFYWWRISNDGDENEQPLSILVFGREMIADDVVATFFANHRFSKDKLAQCTPGKAASNIETHRQQHDDIVIMERPSWRQSVDDGLDLFQTLLDTGLEINGRSYDEILEQAFGKRARKKLRQSVEKSPTIRETRALEDILQFREELLVPSAKAAHGEQAHIPTEDEFRALADKLILFLIEEDGRPVAGELSIYSKRTQNLRMYRIGMTDELLNDSRLKSQYHIAFFAHILKLACDMKLLSISHGLTSPALNHGNLIYKLRLSCIPVRLPDYPKCEIRFNSERLPEILEMHPLLVIRDDTFAGMIGVRQSLPDGEVKEHFNSFFKGCTYEELERIDCVVHTAWYEKVDSSTLDQLELYELNGVDQKEDHTLLTFNRRRDM